MERGRDGVTEGPRDPSFSLSLRPSFLSPGLHRAVAAPARCLVLIMTLLAVAGCAQKMDNQPRYEAFEKSEFFDDGLASRPLVEGTVARGHLRLDRRFYTGKQPDGEPVETFPLETLANKMDLTGSDEEIRRAVLDRGRNRFDVFCAACHGKVGTGESMVVRAGFPRPPSYHIDRLRDVPIGHFYDVITNGLGRMPDFAARIEPPDRWAIAAYVRALQFSQHANVSALPQQDRQRLEQLEE